MTGHTQRRLAIGAALAGVALFVLANAHLLAVAFQSQPDCVAVASAARAAKHAC